MLSENELWMIEDINRQTIRCLQPFICFKHTEKEEYKPTLKQVLKYGKQELSTRVDIPFILNQGISFTPRKN